MTPYKKPLAILLFTAIAATASLSARADDDFVVYSPYVTAGQSEIEMRGHQVSDGDPTLQGERAYEVSVSHSFTDWWRPEVYVGAYEREPGQGNSLDGYEFENTFQLTTPGEYWADAGFLFDYEYSTHEGEPNVIEFGPLFERDAGGIRQRLNLLWEKQLGSLKEETGYEIHAAYALNYLWSPKFSPGIDVFARDAFWQAGPSFSGEIHFGRSEFEYEAGLVFGLSAKAPDTTLLLRLEYEYF